MKRLLFRTVFLGLCSVSLVAQVNRPDAQKADIPQQAQVAAKLPCVMPQAKQPTRRPSKPKQPAWSQYEEELTPEILASFAKSHDDDCDGISNYDDNWREVASKDLTDSDGDGWGNVCDNISSDIRVRMFSTRLDAKVGDRIKFSIIVTNNGPTQEALKISLVDVFPSALRVKTIETFGAECEGMADEEDGGLLCEISSLPVGKSATLVVHTTARRVGTVRNTVTVENGIGDLNRKDNRASLKIRIRR